eukprot:395657-Pleurochrysis_carterae.AAC.9
MRVPYAVGLDRGSSAQLPARRLLIAHTLLGIGILFPSLPGVAIPGSPIQQVSSPASAMLRTEPSTEAVLVARRAFEAFDRRQLPLADALFTQTIEEWRRLNRSVEELTTLLVARANVRVDRKEFAAAVADLDEAINLMSPTGTGPSGVARYREFPDAFVQRGLAREGLRDWVGAVSDYDRAVSLWGGEGGGVNPYALTYRGRARSEVGDLDGALLDFQRAAGIFSSVDKNNNQAAAARAQEAVTLYGLGRRDEAVRIARQVHSAHDDTLDCIASLNLGRRKCFCAQLLSNAVYGSLHRHHCSFAPLCGPTRCDQLP